MDMYSGHINKLIEELAALPGIGSKSAQRLAFHLINMPKEKVDRLANIMMEAKANNGEFITPKVAHLQFLFLTEIHFYPSL